VKIVTWSSGKKETQSVLCFLCCYARINSIKSPT